MRDSDRGAHGDVCGRSCEVHLLCAAAELRPSAWTGSCVVSARVSAPDTDSASLSSVRISQAIVGSPRARLAFLPALTLAGFWIGGEMALIAIALGLPALAAGR